MPPNMIGKKKKSGYATNVCWVTEWLNTWINAQVGEELLSLGRFWVPPGTEILVISSAGLTVTWLISTPGTFTLYKQSPGTCDALKVPLSSKRGTTPGQGRFSRRPGVGGGGIFLLFPAGSTIPVCVNPWWGLGPVSEPTGPWFLPSVKKEAVTRSSASQVMAWGSAASSKNTAGLRAQGTANHPTCPGQTQSCLPPLLPSAPQLPGQSRSERRGKGPRPEPGDWVLASGRRRSPASQKTDRSLNHSGKEPQADIIL